jgi:hypothetical protein
LPLSFSRKSVIMRSTAFVKFSVKRRHGLFGYGEITQHRHKMIGKFAFRVDIQLGHGSVQLRHEFTALVTLPPDLETNVGRSGRTQVERTPCSAPPIPTGIMHQFF